MDSIANMDEFAVGILWTSALLVMVFLGVRVFAKTRTPRNTITNRADVHRIPTANSSMFAMLSITWHPS